MNSIKGKLDNSDYEIYDVFMNFQIDGYWLDEKIHEYYPDKMIKGTVPTLLFWMELEREKEVVWNRILPRLGQKTKCPILMCPDDCDFGCTLVMAEIEHHGSTITWNKIGVDATIEFEAEKVGSEIEWFDKISPLRFDIGEYSTMLDVFRSQFQLDKQKWEERQRK